MTTFQQMFPSESVPVSALEQQALIQFALSLCPLIDQSTLASFRTPISSEDKPTRAYFDPVTEADKATEARLREQIRQRYPEHGILGEEYGFEPTVNGLTWVLDPIDGTRSFISGIPMWMSLIGLYAGRQPLFGLAYQPYTQEVFYGTPRQSFLRRGEQHRVLRASGCQTLDKAKLLTTDPRLFSEQEQARFEHLQSQSLMSRYGTDAYGYCLLASGQVDVVCESGLALYDYLPLWPILLGAGVCVSNWQGEPLGQSPQALLACATATLHGQARQALQR